MNGYTDWNAWNVSLWLHNNESYYNLMQQCIRKNSNLHDACRNLMAWLTVNGADTPDGAAWNVASIEEAITEEWEEYWNE